MVLCLFGVVDPFHTGMKYMGEGLPMAVMTFLAWILLFKLWSFYNILFVITNKKSNKDWVYLLLTQLFLNTLLVLLNPFPMKGDDGIYLGMISFVLTTFIFYGWVMWKRFSKNNRYEKVSLIERSNILIGIELITLTIALFIALIEGTVDLLFTAQLILSAIIAFFWMLYELYSISIDEPNQ